MTSKKEAMKVLKKRGLIYAIRQGMKIINDPDFARLIKGYYASPSGYTSMMIKHNGAEFADIMAYHIEIFKTMDGENIVRGTQGFCAALRHTIQMLMFSDSAGFTPVVEWGNTATYYDSAMDSLTMNVFEYYFQPTSIINFNKIKDCRNVIEARVGHRWFFSENDVDHHIDYHIEQNEIEKLGCIYKKYIHLNQNTEKYIEKNLNEILNNEKILAVHVRGTDFNLGIKDHPIVITPKEYLAKAKALFAGGQYAKVFLATEDINVLELFKQEFKDNLLYYTDVFRTENHIGPHGTPDERPLHYYKLGLEILRDVYTLANCTSLICGLSQVSFAARYINIALDRRFDEIVVLNHGLSIKDSGEVKRVRKLVRKRNQEFGK